ncbi:MAG: hypothetical protein L7F77_03625 [Candidatus Magnetominusculus sp. LBB02]|nr:hypothetical protein [Candidatus Magnetominusculus sp. LBB02]
MKQYSYIFTKQLGIHAVMYFIGIAIIVALGILPGRNEIIQLDSKIDYAQSQLEEKNSLLSTYHLLSEIKKQPMTLPMPVKKPINKEKMEDVIKALKESAKAAGLKAVSITPDVNTMTKGSQMYVINTRLEGEFPGLRHFLLETAALPYVGNVASISINNEFYSKEQSFDINVEVMLER